MPRQAEQEFLAPLEVTLTIPATLRRFASKIASLDDDRSDRNGWWVYLKPGWRLCDDLTHQIHESTLKECAWKLSRVVPCDCEDCKQ